jgi:hypothetical protein
LFFSFILDYPPTTTELARVNSVSIFIFSIYQALIAKYHKYLLLYEKKKKYCQAFLVKNFKTYQKLC